MALRPASRDAATMRAASASSVRSPNIIVPSHRRETFRPLAPSAGVSVAVGFITASCHRPLVYNRSTT